MRFADYGKRVVFAAFDGGEITSDAGVLLLREQARRIRLFERMAGCFTDHRDRERLTHDLPALLAQRVCGMALGYDPHFSPGSGGIPILFLQSAY